VVRVVLPRVLAAEVDGQRSFEVEAETVGDALRTLPIADLLFTERGDWHDWLFVYIDGTDARDRGGLRCPLAGAHEVRVLAAVQGG